MPVVLAKKHVIFKQSSCIFDEYSVFVVNYDTFVSGKCRKLLKIAQKTPKISKFGAILETTSINQHFGAEIKVLTVLDHFLFQKI